MIENSIIQYIRSFIKKINQDNVNAFSAQAAFFIIISFFPFIMFLLTLLQYLPFSEEDLLIFFEPAIPDTFYPFVLSIIREIYLKASGTLISATAITALWSASKGFLAIVRGLNAVYDIKETRNYVKLRFVSTLYTLVFAIMIIITLALLVFGNKIYTLFLSKFPMLSEFALFLISIRTTVTLSILVLFFLAIYVVIPNRHSTILEELPGALLCSVGWMGFSYLFSFYIDNMGNYSYMYGSLTTIVLLMLWLYACMYILFFGAEFNLLIQKSNIIHQFLSILKNYKKNKK